MLSRRMLVALGVVHLLVAVWHGMSHTELAVALSPGQALFVYIVVLLAPIVGVALLWTRHASFGICLFLAAMGASLLFGVYYHYVLVSPDNVRHLPAGSELARARFKMSAMVLALVELASVVIATLALVKRTRLRADLAVRARRR